MPPWKKEVQTFLGIIFYLHKFSLSNADICEILRQLTSSKTEWTQNAAYKKLFDKEKSIITEDPYMKFYDEHQLLHLETNASAIWLRAALLQVVKLPKRQSTRQQHIRPITFASKSLSSTEWRYRNIEREALGILHGLEKFHHYYFSKEMNVITGHKLLVAIFKKDEAMLSQRMQWILLRICQYRERIMYKCGPDLFIAPNHMENKDEEIPGMQLNVDAVWTITNILYYMMIQQL